MLAWVSHNLPERNLPTRVENVCPYVPAAHILYERNEELMDMHRERERESVVVWPSFCETVQKDTCLPPSLAHMSRHSRDFAEGKREGVGSRGQSAKGSIVAPQSVRHCLVIGVCKVRSSSLDSPSSSSSFSKSADVNETVRSCGGKRFQFEDIPPSNTYIKIAFGLKMSQTQ